MSRLQGELETEHRRLVESETLRLDTENRIREYSEQVRRDVEGLRGSHAAELLALRGQLLTHEADIRQGEESKRTLQEQLSASESSLSDTLESQRAALTELADLQGVAQGLQQSLAVAENERRAAENRLEKVLKENETRSAVQSLAYEALRKNFEDQVLLSEINTKEKEQAFIQLQAAQSHNQNLEQTRAAERTLFETQMREMAGQFSVVEQRLLHAIQEKEHDRVDYERRERDMQENISRLRQEQSELTLNLAQSAARVNALGVELSAARDHSGVLENRVAMLEAELIAAYEERQQRDAETSALRAAKLQQDVQVQKLQADLLEGQGMIFDLRSQLLEAKGKVKNSKAREIAAERKVDQLETTLQEANRESGELRDRISSLQSEATAEKEQLLNDLNAVQDIITAMSAQLSAAVAERNALHDRLVEFEERMGDLNQRLTASLGEADKLRQNLVAITLERDKLSTTCLGLQEQNAQLFQDKLDLERRLGQGAVRYDQLESKYQDALKVIQTLESDMRDAKTAETIAERRLQSLQEELKETSQQNTERISTLQLECVNLRAELEQNRSQVRNYENALRDLQESAARKELEMTALQNHNREQGAEIERLREFEEQTGLLLRELQAQRDEFEVFFDQQMAIEAEKIAELSDALNECIEEKKKLSVELADANSRLNIIHNVQPTKRQLRNRKPYAR